jgi:hypothetical protein
MSTEEKTVEQELTFGQQIAGVTHNPSDMPEVDTVKHMCASLIDALANSFDNQQIAPMHGKIIDAAIMKIVEAQMMVVKALTFNK